MAFGHLPLELGSLLLSLCSGGLNTVAGLK
jgi:hypothetical protein